MTEKEFNLLMAMADYLFTQIQARQLEDDLSKYDVAVKELILARQYFIKEYNKLYGKNEDKTV